MIERLLPCILAPLFHTLPNECVFAGGGGGGGAVVKNDWCINGSGGVNLH